MQIRQQLEQIEEKNLSKHAALAKNSAGRARPEPDCLVRTCFQRDVDRIIHSKAFRRLNQKTQVFISPNGDHYRTRLTHTLEVTQIAKTIARGLFLNLDLTEAVALGHDLGHTPFGHVGENVLDRLCESGYEHNRQSLRVVEVLENSGAGLNLTAEVKNGILCHTGNQKADTLEGRIVHYADRIAYVNHDIDDAIRGRVLLEEQIPADIVAILGATKRERINNLVVDIIQNSGTDIGFSQVVGQALLDLRRFMFEHVYQNKKALPDLDKAAHVVEQLYKFYIKNPEQMPQDYSKYLKTDGLERTVCDFVSGMTDRYAIIKFEELFVPRGSVPQMG